MPVKSLSSGTLGLRFMQRGPVDSSQKPQQQQKQSSASKSESSSANNAKANQNPSHKSIPDSSNLQDEKEQETVWGNRRIVTVSSYMSMPTIKGAIQDRQSGIVAGRRSFGKFNKSLEPKDDDDDDGDDDDNDEEPSSKKSKSSKKKNTRKDETRSRRRRSPSSSLKSDSSTMHVDDDDDSSEEEVARALHPQAQQQQQQYPKVRRSRASSVQEPTSPKKRLKNKHSNSNNAAASFMKPSGFGEALPSSKMELDDYQPDEDFADSMIATARQKKSTIIPSQQKDKMNNNNTSKKNKANSGDVDTFLQNLEIDASQQRQSPFQGKKPRRRSKKEQN